MFIVLMVLFVYVLLEVEIVLSVVFEVLLIVIQNKITTVNIETKYAQIFSLLKTNSISYPPDI